MASRRKANQKKKNGVRRPKKAMTAYNLFIRQFLKTRSIKSTQEARKAIQEGAQKWRQLSATEKTKYEEQTHNDKCRHQLEIEQYRSELQARKCPRNSYVTFLQDYCKGHFGALNFKLNFGQIGILSSAAATVWRGLNSLRKQKYKEEFKVRFAQHKIDELNLERRQKRNISKPKRKKSARRVNQQGHQWNNDDDVEEFGEEQEEDFECMQDDEEDQANSQSTQNYRRLSDYEEQEEENVGYKSKLRKRTKKPVY